MVAQQSQVVKPSTASPSALFAAALTARTQAQQSQEVLVQILRTPQVYIAWWGTIEQVGGKLVSHGFEIIGSAMDGHATAFLPTRIVWKSYKGKKRLPYFLIQWALIKQRMPSLFNRLKYFGLFVRINKKKTYTVLLSRFVLAASGERVDDKNIAGKTPVFDAHHIEGLADGTNFLGYSTLDCRREVLEAKNSTTHRSQHKKDPRHYYGP